jgi:hypothetical protein
VFFFKEMLGLKIDFLVSKQIYLQMTDKLIVILTEVVILEQGLLTIK